MFEFANLPGEEGFEAGGDMGGAAPSARQHGSHGRVAVPVRGLRVPLERMELELDLSGLSAGGAEQGSIANPGWYKFGSGLIVQWGCSRYISGDTVFFPVVFPRACMSLVTGDGTPQGDGVHRIGTQGVTRSSFDLLIVGNAGGFGESWVNWLAVGC